jgi:hypothetical protein
MCTSVSEELPSSGWKRKMKAAGTSKTSILIYQTARHHISENCNLSYMLP